MKVTDQTSIRGVPVTRLALGGAPLGNLFQPVPDADATATIRAAWDLGIRFYDVAPLYGYGIAETRMGSSLASTDRNEFALATKVGRLLRVPAEASARQPDLTQMHEGQPFYKNTPSAEPVWDFSYDGAMRSLEESLARLGMDRVDIVHVHDPDDHVEEALSGAFRALIELRDQGVIGAVGVGIDNAAPAARFVREVDIDCVLIAGRWTLLDHEARRVLLPAARARGVGVIAAGVFNSGVLANPSEGATFDYVPCPPDVLARTRLLQSVCSRYDVPLKAAALQFPLRHPAVVSVVSGARTPAEITENAALFEMNIPDELWSDLARECGVPTHPDGRMCGD
jgi:D-threo-aldose 1-dehydrogenase